MLRPAVVILALAAAGTAAGCSSMGQGARDTALATRHGMGSAVVAPLKDFGLMKAKVPTILQQASAEPYRRPAADDCSAVEREVASLDLVLGPDVDIPRGAGKPTMVGRGSRAVSDAALDAVKDLTTGWIPFRGTVRRLTGAADNEDEMEDAVHAGGLRRAYLKGLGLQMGCAHPAAPMLGRREIIASNAPSGTAPAPAVAEGLIVRTSEPAAATVPAAQVTPVSTSSAALVPGV